MLEVEIAKIDVSAKKTQRLTDFVAEERPLSIFLNRAFYVTLLCSPSNLKELTVGYLVSEGVVKSIEEIERLDLKDDVCHVRLTPSVDVEKRLALLRSYQRVILSTCGSKVPYRPSQRLSKIKSNLTVRAEIVLDCVNQLNHVAEIFRKTGGVHAAAIHRSGGVRVAFAEDVGRHNAVDKAIGFATTHGTDLGACFIALTGRLTRDMVMKSARVGLPIVASIAAGIDSGIAVAKKVNLTLIGFVRMNRMTVYANPERIVL